MDPDTMMLADMLHEAFVDAINDPAWGASLPVDRNRQAWYRVAERAKELRAS